MDVMEEKPWIYLEETLVQKKDWARVEESDNNVHHVTR